MTFTPPNLADNARILRILCLATIALTSCAGVTGAAGGSCPCIVGNSGIHVTLGCGESSCVYLNGTATGYRCGSNGATVDPSVCATSQDTADTGSDASLGIDSGVDTSAIPDTGPACTPSTCVELAACGTPDNGCGAKLSCPACTGGAYCSFADHCLQKAASFVIYGNYGGGSFTINVDKHVPGLAIGLVSYQPMTVTVGGPFASDVVAVFHSGYEPGTTVAGISPTLVSDQRMAPATVPAGLGNNTIDCEISATGPGCNPASQVQAFFAATVGGSFLYNQCQYAAFTGVFNVSAGGSCP